MIEKRYGVIFIMANKKGVNKIIYFDKETIRIFYKNIIKALRRLLLVKKDSGSTKIESDLSAETKIKLSLPFFARLSFLFSGKLSNEIYRPI